MTISWRNRNRPKAPGSLIYDPANSTEAILTYSNRISASILILALSLTAPLHAAAAEVFECREENVDSYPILVVATVNDDRQTGVIEVAGTSYETRYGVNGFDRTWVFGEDNEFGFIIEPSGRAKYGLLDALVLSGFDEFDGVPIQLFHCRQR